MKPNENTKSLKITYEHEGELHVIEAPVNFDLRDFAALVKEAGHPKAVIVKMETN